MAALTSRLRMFQKVNSLFSHCTCARIATTRSVSGWTWNNSSLINPKRQTPNRQIHKTAYRRNNPSYEPDGKTTVTVMNDEHGAPLMVDSYNPNGFELNNGMQVIGPMIVFPRTVLGWDVEGPHDITPASLALFSILEPKPDVLVIGVGDGGAKIPVETIKYLKSKKINMEILPTEHACTTFNFLSVEGRCSVAVMIPPTRIVWTAFDLANTKLMKRKLYEEEDIDPVNPFPDANKPPPEGTERVGDFVRKLVKSPRNRSK